MQLGAVEINTTHIICAVGNDMGEIIYKRDFPLDTTETTTSVIVEYFKAKRIKGLGIILCTHLNDAFLNFDWCNHIQEYLKVPIAIDTNNDENNNKTIISALMLIRQKV